MSRESLFRELQYIAALVPAGTLEETANTTNHPDAVDVNQSQKVAIAQPVSHWTVADAARMLAIAAKEGDAVAERELAICYLASPDLLQPTVSPICKPKKFSSSRYWVGGRRFRRVLSQ